MDSQRIHKSIWLGLAMCFVLALVVVDSVNKENMGLPSRDASYGTAASTGLRITVLGRHIRISIPRQIEQWVTKQERR